jgi:hypothetical protein
MNTRSILSFPTPKAAPIPRRRKPIGTLPDLVVALVVIAVMAAALLLLM